MKTPRALPWPGIMLALAAGGAMLSSGINPWLVLGILVMWIGTLRIAQPEPRAIKQATDSVELTREAMRDLIEHFTLPLLMLDRNRVIIANSSAREVFGNHIVGQDARVGLRHPQAVALLDRQGGGSATIKGLTTPRSIWQMTRHAINNRYWMIELHNRTAEADISRAHTDFVANASHELRTPLSSIIGYMETLIEQKDETDPALAERFHGTVLREARRLQSLVSDLMSLSRIEAEKHDLPTESIDFTKLAAKAAAESGQADDKARIKVDVSDDPQMVSGDRQQLEQLIRNLVDNALKYGAAGEPVEVRVKNGADGRVNLTVTDYGEGIAAEHIPHLTRRFYRTDPGRSRAAGGTGLGLAIVKHIVERHRGRLDIESKPGQGTIVTVKLPAMEKPGQASS